jgi:hypothetical protein
VSIVPHHTAVPFAPETTMVQPILFAAALLGVCAAASPLFKKDDGSPCFNATIRKEYLLQITTYQPYDPYNSAVMTNNVNSIRLHIADPTNQNQNAITCTTASWNSTEQPFPSDYLACSDPTLSYKLTSYTDNSTFSLIINQTFVQGAFSETVLASYNATKKDLNGYACGANTGCSAYYQSVRTHLIHFKSNHVQAEPLTRNLTGRPRSRNRLRRPEERPTLDHLPGPVSTSSSAHAPQLANQVQLRRPRKLRRHVFLCCKLHRLRLVDQRPKRLPRHLQRPYLGLDSPANPARRLVPLPGNQLHSRELVFPRRSIHGLPDFQLGDQAAYLQRGAVPG